MEKFSLSLDDIINDIGFGKFHLKQYVVVCLIMLNFISHAVISGYILPTMINHWNLTLFEQCFLGCFEYSLQVLASIITSYSTVYGRKKPILISMIIWTISVFLASVFDNFYVFCMLRGIITCSALVCNLISYTMLSEVLPMKYRGKLLGSFEFAVIFGHLQLILLMFGTFENLGNGNIQMFIFSLFLTMLFTTAITFLWCEESPRYLCFQNKFEDCVSLLNRIYKENRKITNNEDIYMNSEKKIFFSQWLEIMTKQELCSNNQEQTSLSSLFQGNYKSITITLYFVWFANCLVSAGNDFIFPLTLYKIFKLDSENLILTMFFMNLIAIPFLIPSVLIIDMKIFGRKKTLTFSLILLGISSFFIWTNFVFNVIIWLVVAKYAIAMNFMILSIYTNEIYPTNLRSFGFGTSVSIGKLGSIFSPIISIYLSDANTYLPFCFFSVISLIGGIMLSNLKYDTTNENMDRILKNDTEMVFLKEEGEF